MNFWTFLDKLLPLLGVILGAVMSYFPIRWQLNDQSKKDKQRVAEKIIASIFSFNVSIETNIVYEKYKNQDQKVDFYNTSAVIKIDEAIGLAKLYVSDELASNIANIKTTIHNLAKAVIKNQTVKKRNLPEYKKFILDYKISDLTT